MQYSVIIPVYNAESTLRRCLDSLINQQSTDYELIVINDGSTDGSEAICREYANMYPQIRYFMKENGGLSSARNMGLEQARGDYIMFVDSDDWMDKDACSRAINIAMNCGADIVIWSYVREYSGESFPMELFNGKDETWHDSQTREVFRRLIGLVNEELMSPQKIDNLVTVWGKLYRRMLLEGKQFIDNKLIGSEDLLFNVPVFYEANCISYIATPMYHYQKENDISITHHYPDELLLRYTELHKRIRKFIDEKELPEEYTQALDNRVCLSIIGLGLRLVDDGEKTAKDCIAELRRLRDSDHFGYAINKLSLKAFTLQWKIFFFCVQKKLYFVWFLMLKAMNQLRRTR